MKVLFYREYRDRLAWLDYGLEGLRVGAHKKPLSSAGGDSRSQSGSQKRPELGAWKWHSLFLDRRKMQRDAADFGSTRSPRVQEESVLSYGARPPEGQSLQEPLKGRQTMRTGITVSLGWIARRLDLRSASKVCHKMRRYSGFKS
jgi:hypothetical protein